jgi:hypothetical protein
MMHGVLLEAPKWYLQLPPLLQLVQTRLLQLTTPSGCLSTYMWCTSEKDFDSILCGNNGYVCHFRQHFWANVEMLD